jgi:chromosome segregation ATPase
VDKQLFVLNNKLAGFEEIGGKLAIARGDLIVYERDNDTLKKRRVEYQADLELLRDKKSKQEVLIAQKVNIEAKIQELLKQLRKETDTNEADLIALRTAYRDFQEEIKKNEELLKQTDEINSAAEKETEIQGKIDLLSEQIEGFGNALSGNQSLLDETMADLSCIQGGINDCEKDIVKWKNNHEATALQNSLEQAIKQSEILEKRDPTCQSSTCSFIVAALKAKESLPQLGIDLGIKHNEISESLSWLNNLLASLKDERITLEEKIAGIKKEVTRINGLSSEAHKDVARLRLDLSKVKELAGKKTALAVAQTQYDNVTRQMEENATKGKELKVKWENRKSDLDGSINDAKASLSDIEKQIDENIEIQIMETENTIKAVDDKLSAMDRHINDTRALIMKYEADVSARAEVEYDIGAANVEKNKLLQDISDWTYLRNSCGKNGLQAMEIDGAAPIITSFANDLLMNAFGPVFTVKFRTINDEGKECLDIIIINGDGEEVLLDNLSGGQKVWNLIALRQGMTLLSAEKSGKEFGSFFADEMDGPLDPENAVNFVNMYRSFMKLGGFEDGFFISHKPECRSLADHTLMFEAGKNPYWN